MVQGDKVTLIALSPKELRYLLSRQELAEGVSIKLQLMEKAPHECYLWYTYWVILARSQKEVGFIGFKGFDGTRTTELGYGVGSSYSGRGYASEAVGLLLRWASYRTDWKRIVATVDSHNQASLRVLEKNGFQFLYVLNQRLHYQVLAQDLRRKVP